MTAAWSSLISCDMYMAYDVIRSYSCCSTFSTRVKYDQPVDLSWCYFQHAVHIYIYIYIKYNLINPVHLLAVVVTLHDAYIRTACNMHEVINLVARAIEVSHAAGKTVSTKFSISDRC